MIIMMNELRVCKSVANYKYLRSNEIAIRKKSDMLIAAFCI